MKNKGVLWVFLFVVLTLLTLGSIAHSNDMAALNAAIQARGGGWVAGETSMSRLSPEEQARRLGLKSSSFAPGDKVLAATGTEVSLPISLDWRNNSGNYVTPIKNQASCGSCWAFATTGGAESATLIANNSPNVDLDLSEQVMLSCSGAGSCQGGELNLASDYLLKTGLPPESCYPYRATDDPCSFGCTGWELTAPKIKDWAWVVPPGGTPTVAAIKNALNTHGPLPAAMAVYDDFNSYVSGVYRYTSGSWRGNHGVLIIGYDDANQYFIVKNSWGTRWGEQGYFRIAYSELVSGVRFGYETIAYTGVAAPGTLTNLNGASYGGSALAQESIVAAFGKNLSITTGEGSQGTKVTVKDSAGSQRDAFVYFASPGQVNYQMPPGTNAGVATCTITNAQGGVSNGSAPVVQVSPGLFSANADGKGVAAANILRIKADGSQAYEPVARYDWATGKWVSIPVALGPEGEQLFLILYGTGIRFHGSLQSVVVTIGGLYAEVLYAGSQHQYLGLDQVNVRVPRSLQGRGEMNVVLSINGRMANTVTFNVQ